MYVDIQHQYNSANENLEEQKEPVFDKLEKRNRDLIQEMFKNQAEFPSGYSIVKSKRFD